MTKQQLYSGDYSHSKVVNELEHNIKERIETNAIDVQAIKIPSIDPLSGIDAIILVTDSDKCLTNSSEQSSYYTLWKVHYDFHNLKNWNTKMIQNTAKFEAAEELPDFNSFIENEKCSAEEASKRCFRKFLSIRTFEQKRLVKTY